MHPAIAAYLEREKQANTKPQGADHQAILADVAQEHGLNPRKLRDLVIAHTIREPN